MPNYRRSRIEGATFFFTVNLFDRASGLLVSHIEELREVRRLRRFDIDAWVVLPDHMHCIWTLPDGDCDFPGRWRAIKTTFSKSLPDIEHRSPAMIRRGERGIWQRRYWEHTIRDDADYRAHMDYVHFNPVKHGLVETAKDWPYSSFRRCVEAGFYPENWWGSGGDNRRNAPRFSALGLR
jgi:putative transposase